MDGKLHMAVMIDAAYMTVVVVVVLLLVVVVVLVEEEVENEISVSQKDMMDL